ncbi:MAG: PKD domain-containing protein [Halolamina sp.]
MRTTTAIALALLLVTTAGMPATAHGNGNDPPMADAGLDQRVTRGAVVFLDGGGSVDPDGVLAEYRWKIRSPNGSRVSPRNASAPLTQFRPSQIGRYEVQLTVTDDDGATRSDTLYVDVVAASDGSGGDQPSSGDGSSDASSGTGAPGGTSGSDRGGNRAPDVSLFGPAEVSVGEPASYSISASDSDGRVVERKFGGALGGGGTKTEHVFDSPGTYWVSITVTDDDGATATARKQVTVSGARNLSVSIDGPTLVPDGTYATYTARVESASGQVEYFWSPRVKNVRQTDRSFEHFFTGRSGDEKRISVIVRDSGGKTATASKLIEISKKETSEKYVMDLNPSIIDTSMRPAQAYVNDGTSVLTSASYQISTTVIDRNNESVWVTWKFEDGTVKKKRVPAAGGGKTVSILKSFVKNNAEGKELVKKRRVSFIIKAADNSGLEDSSSYSAKIQRLKDYGELHFQVFSSTVEPGDAVTIQFHSLGGTVVDFGDGTRLRYHEDANTAEHTYSEPGNYTITVFAMDGNMISQRGTKQVRVAKTTFVEYHFEQNATRVESVTKAEQPPGKGWERKELDHVEIADRSVREKELLDSERVNDRMTERGWTKAGETTKERVTTESKLASSSPGPEWSLSERGADEEKRIVRWERQEIGQSEHVEIEPEWRYRGTKQNERRIVKTSTTRPGSGWDRGKRVGKVRDGYDYETFDTRGHPGWSYRSSTCSREIDTARGEMCIDTDYKYRKPEYDRKYRWTKTRTSTVDVYEIPVRDTVKLHRYERDVSTEVRYIIWKQEQIEYENHYVWERADQVTRAKASLTKPTPEYYVNGTLEKHEHSCESRNDDRSNRAC